MAGAIGKGVQREYLDKQIAPHCEFLEQHLNKGSWFVGNDFSAADIQMSFPLEAMAARGALDDCRNCAAFCNAFTPGRLPAGVGQGGPPTTCWANPDGLYSMGSFFIEVAHAYANLR